jgi:hypothetical protein
MKKCLVIGALLLGALALPVPSPAQEYALFKTVDYNNETCDVVSADVRAYNRDQSGRLTINTGFRYTYDIWGHYQHYRVEVTHDADRYPAHGFSWNGFRFYVKWREPHQTSQEAIDAAIAILQELHNQ